MPIKTVEPISRKEMVTPTCCEQEFMGMKVYTLYLALMTFKIMQELSSSEIPQLLNITCQRKEKE